MRPFRVSMAVAVVIFTLGAPAAFAADRPGVHAPSDQAHVQPVAGLMHSPQMPVGALVFAAVGSFFLFRRGRAPLPEVQERD